MMEILVVVTNAVSGWVTLATIGAVIVVSGLVVILARFVLGSRRPRGTKGTAVEFVAPADDADATMVRSWIAISLVSGLLIFCAVALYQNDQNLRDILFGALTSSVGAAVAYYFSTKAAAQARKDVMDATQGTSEVPNLVGHNLHDAEVAMSRTSFRLVTLDPKADPGDKVLGQSIQPGMTARNGSSLVIETKKS
jgi:hypothetical protein